VVSAFAVSSEQRYTADRPGWAALLSSELDELPVPRDWPQLLAVLRRVLRWSEQPDLATTSGYLRASRARDLLEAISGDLAFAGIPTHCSPSPDGTWASLEKVCERVLTAIGAGDAPVPQ
jgi:hypothetical protein